MVTASVIGARGYLGRELMRILVQHPDVERVQPVSTTQAGRQYAELVPSFRHMPDLEVVPVQDAGDADVAFLATPGGEAAKLVPELEARGTRLCVDLSRDHRLEALDTSAPADNGIASNGKNWVYGLADVTPLPPGTRRVANPGCYPTASLLASHGALAADLVSDGPIIADGKSGVSGAGVSPRADLHYPEQNESVRAYNVLGHDHTAEIRHAARRMNGGTDRPVRFTPHLVPQTRGLLSTVYLPLRDGVDAGAVAEAYERATADSTFVHLVDEPDTGHVRGSNHANIAVDVDEEAMIAVARCSIDNLVKGGAGQAVQCMNQSLGLPEDAGLRAPGGTP